MRSVDGGAPLYTVVSRPRAVELAILDALAPRFIGHRRLAGGVSLRTLESTEPRPGSTVVLLHGRGHAATMWAPVAARLSEKHAVVAADLPGFGHSASAPLAARDGAAGLAFFAAPIRAWLEARKDAGLVVVGHSLGGLVALDLALARTLPVRALVLVDAMGLSPTVTARSRLYLRTGPERIARMRRLARIDRAPSASGGDVASQLAPLRLELLTARGGRPDAARAFDTMMPLTGSPFHVRERLGEIDVPVLLLWGERDDAFPLPVAIDASTRLPNARIAVVNAGHSPHVEAPTATTDAIEAFLSTLS